MRRQVPFAAIDRKTLFAVNKLMIPKVRGREARENTRERGLEVTSDPGSLRMND